MDARIYERLSEDPTLTALVGTRIFPTRPTNDTVLPFVVYQLTGGEPQYTLSGPTGLVRYEFTIDYWATTQAAAIDVGEAVASLLNGWRSASVQGSFLTNHADEYDSVGFHGFQVYSIWG